MDEILVSRAAEIRRTPDRPVPERQLGARLREFGICLLRLGRRKSQHLRLCESLPLGDRRFVALIECDGARFLIGGTGNSLVLLTPLNVPSENAGRNESSHQSASCVQEAD
jgi:hypothetical protein